jgi:hypothetical protein
VAGEHPGLRGNDSHPSFHARIGLGGLLLLLAARMG